MATHHARPQSLGEACVDSRAPPPPPPRRHARPAGPAISAHGSPAHLPREVFLAKGSASPKQAGAPRARAERPGFCLN